MLTQPSIKLSDKDRVHLGTLLVIINVVLVMKKWIISSLVAGFALIFSAITVGTGYSSDHGKKDFNSVVKTYPYQQRTMVEIYLKRYREINNKLTVYQDLKHTK